MNPVKALLAGAFGSGFVRANTKYQLATPPFVIHIFCPFNIHSSPFFSAFVLIPFTSEPAPGSVTPYAYFKREKPEHIYYYYGRYNEEAVLTATRGSSINLPRYFFCCSLFPATKTGVCCKITIFYKFAKFYKLLNNYLIIMLLLLNYIIAMYLTISYC